MKKLVKHLRKWLATGMSFQPAKRRLPSQVPRQRPAGQVPPKPRPAARDRNEWTEYAD